MRGVHRPNRQENFDEVACRMFKSFSRLEYALKATGFHRGEGDAQPNWVLFSQEIADVFVNPEAELKRAIDYLLEDPPRKQIIRNGILTFESAEPGNVPRAEKILIYACRVRNNLFHGGKFMGDEAQDLRDRELLKAVMVILSACIQRCARVQGSYNQP